jgi:hypothetical protein
VLKDLFDDLWLIDETDDPHLSMMALGTSETVCLVDLSYEEGPTFVKLLRCRQGIKPGTTLEGQDGVQRPAEDGRKTRLVAGVACRGGRVFTFDICPIGEYRGLTPNPICL